MQITELMTTLSYCVLRRHWQAYHLQCKHNAPKKSKCTVAIFEPLVDFNGLISY